MTWTPPLIIALTLNDGEPLSARLTTLRFRHTIAELYEVDLVLHVDEAKELENAVGAAVRIAIPNMPAWSLGRLEGILWSAQLMSISDEDVSQYALRIAPPARLLAEREDHRIFQQQDIATLVATVIGGFGHLPQPANRSSSLLKTELWCSRRVRPGLMSDAQRLGSH